MGMTSKFYNDNDYRLLKTGLVSDNCYANFYNS